MGEFFDTIQIFPVVDIALYVENGSQSPGRLWQSRHTVGQFCEPKYQARHKSVYENECETVVLKFGIY